MECIGCRTSIRSATSKIWNHLLLCNGCFAIAERAERELKAALKRAEEQSKQWLEQWILQGQHLKGGSGLQLPGLGNIGEDHDNGADKGTQGRG